jgi:hypothetical protein
MQIVVSQVRLKASYQREADFKARNPAHGLTKIQEARRSRKCLRHRRGGARLSQLLPHDLFDFQWVL